MISHFPSSSLFLNSICQVLNPPHLYLLNFQAQCFTPGTCSHVCLWKFFSNFHIFPSFNCFFCFVWNLHFSPLHKYWACFFSLMSCFSDILWSPEICFCSSLPLLFFSCPASPCGRSLCDHTTQRYLLIQLPWSGWNFCGGQKERGLHDLIYRSILSLHVAVHLSLIVSCLFYTRFSLLQTNLCTSSLKNCC